jgi:hypothetical protein
MKSFLLLLASVIKLELNYRKFDVLDFFFTIDCAYSWLQKKTGTVRIKLTLFLPFFHGGKSYERLVRMMVKIQ